jgi:uncharacterized repeat protein (TIGR03806 family)
MNIHAAAKQFHLLLSGLACALLLQACGGKDDPPIDPNDTTPPTIPAAVVATSQSASSIRVTWQASTDVGSGVAGYRVYRNNGTSAIATVTSTSYVDTGLAASTSYSYTVSAFDGGANDSGRSAVATASTTADTTAPTVPANLNATVQSVSAIQLSWQASTDTESGVAGYYLYRDGNATPIATVTTGTSYQDIGLRAATTYSYSVAAFDSATPANVSPLSALVSATTASAGGNQVGLDARPSNTSCLAGDAPSGNVTLGVERIYPNLSFSSPILMLQEPASSARWFVVEQGGRVYRFDAQDAMPVATLVIDVSTTITGATGGEMGLLGMAFHPGWPGNPRAYLSYTARSSGQLVSRIVEYQTQDGGNTLNVATARTILQVNQPEANHNGGNIAFGPDGLLYIGLGDGGGGGDGHGAIGNGQRLSTLLGKMLRIDVNGTTGATPYAIPAGNPYRFATGTTPNAVCNFDTGAWTQDCPEIYAYGFRNPWRWSFDTGSDELWVGDVGEGAWEEVNKVTLGGNYGWRCFEGNHAYNGTCGPNAASSIKPVAEYGRSEGRAVTGGFVYRGSAIPSLYGRYVFGDYASQQLWHIARDTAPTLPMGAGLATNINMVSFAQDHAGEIYIVNSIGLLHRLVATSGGGGGQVAAQLSATGCVSSTDATQPASGLIPYSPNAPFWSDGAAKSRWLALPNGQNIVVNNDGDFDLPNGTVLVKNFRLNSKLIETRLFMRHTNGSWAGYTYEWNTAGTDATRVVGGKTATKEGQSWRYPSESQCLQCHTAAAGRSLGLEQSQLNGLVGYPQTGRTANQLHTLNALSMLSPALVQPVEQLPAMPDPYGSAGSLNDRARAWLHTNCSQCHRPGGPSSVDMDLRYTTSLANTQACDVPATNTLGIPSGRRIATLASGANPASRSLVIHRAGLTDTDSMPPMQPRTVDTAGMTLLTQWMNSLASCG